MPPPALDEPKASEGTDRADTPDPGKTCEADSGDDEGDPDTHSVCDGEVLPDPHAEDDGNDVGEGVGMPLALADSVGDAEAHELPVGDAEGRVLTVGDGDAPADNVLPRDALARGDGVSDGTVEREADAQDEADADAHCVGAPLALARAVDVAHADADALGDAAPDADSGEAVVTPVTLAVKEVDCDGGCDGVAWALLLGWYDGDAESVVTTLGVAPPVSDGDVVCDKAMDGDCVAPSEALG